MRIQYNNPKSWVAATMTGPALCQPSESEHMHVLFCNADDPGVGRPLLHFPNPSRAQVCAVKRQWNSIPDADDCTRGTFRSRYVLLHQPKSILNRASLVSKGAL